MWDNGVDLDPCVGEKGFAGTLATNGYETAFFGKAHFSTKATFQPTGTPECMRSGARYGADWRGPYMGFEHVELSVLGHYNNPLPLEESPVGHYERWVTERADRDAVLRLWGDLGGPTTEGAAQTWHSALPVAWHSSSWLADRGIAWLAERDWSRPFCAWMSFPDPHQPFDCPLPRSLLHDPRNMRLPRHRRADLRQRPWWYQASLAGTPQLADPDMRQLRAKISRIPQQSDRQLAHMTANYYGMVALIDHNVGRVLSALEERGARDTFVIFTTDHGEMLGNHGLYLKGPWPLDDLLRVGLIVSGPGVAEGRVVEDPVSTLDLAPTFHDLAGVAPSCDLQGTTLKPLLDGEFQHREAAYSEWHLHPSRCGVGLQLRTVRTRNYKCTFELSSGAGELYDLANDPDETINRFDDAAFAGVRDDLYALMRARPGTERRQLPEPIGMA